MHPIRSPDHPHPSHRIHSNLNHYNPYIHPPPQPPVLPTFEEKGVEEEREDESDYVFTAYFQYTLRRLVKEYRMVIEDPANPVRESF